MVKAPQNKTPIDGVITWIGSIPSIIFHSVVFTGFLILTLSGALPRDLVLLVWNTIVSLEAIYLAIFIQFSVNKNTASLREVEEDIDEIQEDVEELGEDVEEIQEDLEEVSKDVGEIQEDIEEVSKDVGEIQEDIEEVSKDVEEIQEDLEEINEDDVEDEKQQQEHSRTLEQLTEDMRHILNELEGLKKKK